MNLRRIAVVALLLYLTAWFILMFLAVKLAQARDLDGRYAHSPLRAWFEGLRSPSGTACCDVADGIRLEDPQWGIENGSYWVVLNGRRVTVPDDALLVQPNLAGSAIVWPIFDSEGGAQVRCFIPGAQG